MIMHINTSHTSYTHYNHLYQHIIHVAYTRYTHTRRMHITTSGSRRTPRPGEARQASPRPPGPPTRGAACANCAGLRQPARVAQTRLRANSSARKPVCAQTCGGLRGTRSSFCAQTRSARRPGQQILLIQDPTHTHTLQVTPDIKVSFLRQQPWGWTGHPSERRPMHNGCAMPKSGNGYCV